MQQSATTSSLQFNTEGVRFRRRDGTAWKPRSYIKECINLASGPIEVHHPGDIVKNEEAKGAIQEVHSLKRYLIRSLAMGLPLAKAGLTDMSARISLETQYDCMIRLKSRRTDTEIRIPRQNREGNDRFQRSGRRVVRFPIHTLEDFVRTWVYFEDNGWKGCLEQLEKIFQISLNVPTTPHGTGPLIAMYNGDDNFRGNISYGTMRAQINLEKRGQVNENSKTASSRKYITYCQAPGMSPYSQIVPILVDHVDRLVEEDKNTFSYPIDSQQKCYICKEGGRNKLMSQASKGGRDSQIRTCDTAVTGRSALLTSESSYLPILERLKVSLLHRLAYPQWYTNLSPAERLPSALGGLSAPEVTDTSYIWDSLTVNHRKLITALCGSKPNEAAKAGKILNRAVQSGRNYTHEDVMTRHEEGLNAVIVYNEEIEKAGLDTAIPIFSYKEAFESAMESVKGQSQKSTSVLSGSIHSSDSTEWSYETSRSTKAMRRQIDKDFICLENFDSTFANTPAIIQAVKGELKIEDAPDPQVMHRRVLARIERSSFANSLPEPPDSPPSGRSPWEWMFGARGSKESKLYIKRTDYERIIPPRRLSLRVLPGLLYGYRKHAFSKVKRHGARHTSTIVESSEKKTRLPSTIVYKDNLRDHFIRQILKIETIAEHEEDPVNYMDKEIRWGDYSS